MKITDKIISIPPYISTSWDKISSLHLSEDKLVITLIDGTRVFVPHLTDDALSEIFTAHAHFLDIKPTKTALAQPSMEQAFNAPFRVLFGTLESLTQALQHNPAYSNLAPLPQEIVSKIELLAKQMPQEELANFLHPVDGCNCMYCQISRILKGTGDEKPQIEEEVGEEELRFEEWAVESIGDKLYLVTSKLDPSEQYRVFLGDPIGCTCGKQNCEHIVAVLRH